MLTIYADFNCPYSYLASSRADRLLATGVTSIAWRAIEHDPDLPASGLPTAPDRDRWDEELADVAALALPGEPLPASVPAVMSNTRAAVAAYAESVTDGIDASLRRSIFGSIWVRGANLSSGYAVRALVTALMWTPGRVNDRLASPDLPDALDSDPDLARVVRRSGGTVAADGTPLTFAGHHRVAGWRRDWLALADQTIPAVVDARGGVHAGTDGVAFLARLLHDGETFRPGLARRTRPVARAA